MMTCFVIDARNMVIGFITRCAHCGYDGATSCKNLVNFCPIAPDITELICIPMSVLGENRPTYLHSSCFHLEIRWSTGMLMDTLTAAIIRLYLI